MTKSKKPKKFRKLFEMNDEKLCARMKKTSRLRGQTLKGAVTEAFKDYLKKSVDIQ